MSCSLNWILSNESIPETRLFNPRFHRLNLYKQYKKNVINLITNTGIKKKTFPLQKM